MTTEKERKRLPTLRTLEDAKGRVDIEDIFDLGRLYELGIDDSNDELTLRMGCWHPSSVGYCRRAQVMMYLRMPPTDRRRKHTLEIFEHGHMVHDIVQNRLKTLGPHMAQRGFHYSFEAEVGFDPETDELFIEHHIAGTCDGLLRIWNDSFEQLGVVEIKSQSDDRHEKLKKLQGRAWPNHLMQAHLYAYRYGAPIIWTFYTNKNDAKHEVPVHLFSEKVFLAAVRYFDECAGYVRRGELPPREESWLECSDCVYRTQCDPPKLRAKKREPVQIPRPRARR